MFQGHATEEQTLSGILATAEYFKHAATIVGGGATPSDTVFVKALYAQLFNRVPGSGEISNWVSQIPSIGRQGVAFDLLASLEYRRDVVLGYYITLLRRSTAPSQSEIDSWATSNMDITTIRVGFESSMEFYFRVTGFMP